MSKENCYRDHKRALISWYALFRDRVSLDQEDQHYLMKIMKTIKLLDEEYRKLLVARYFNLKENKGTFRSNAYTASELAERFDISVEIFNNRLMKAEKNFKVLWEKEDPMTDIIVKGNLSISCTLREDGSYLVVYENIETGEHLKSEEMNLQGEAIRS